MAMTNRYISSTGSATYADSTSSSTPCSLTTAIANMVAGDYFWVKADGEYTRIANDSIARSGTATSPIVFEGYSSVIGDARLGRTNGFGPLITTNHPTIAYSAGFILTDGGASKLIWRNIMFLGKTTGTNNWLLNLTADSIIEGCTVTNPSTGANAGGVRLLGARSELRNSDVLISGASGTRSAVYAGDSLATVCGCRVRSVSSVGIEVDVNGAVVDTLVYRCGTRGVQVNGSTAGLRGVTAVLCGSDGIRMASSITLLQKIENCLCTDNTGYGVNAQTADNAVQLSASRLDRNTAGATNLGTDWLSSTSFGNDITSVTQAQEYVSAAGDDYRLLPTSPAKGIGHPLYRDIGAQQRQEAGGLLVNQGMTGGMT